MGSELTSRGSTSRPLSALRGARVPTREGRLRSHHRTFSVNTQRNIYRCFRCGSGGNALDLWASYRKLSIYAAAQEIQDRLSQNKQP